MSGVENIRFGGGRIEFTVNDKSSRYHGKHLELDIESGYAYEFGHVGDDSQRVHYFAPVEAFDTFGPRWRQKADGKTDNVAPAKKDSLEMSCQEKKRMWLNGCGARDIVFSPVDITFTVSDALSQLDGVRLLMVKNTREIKRLDTGAVVPNSTFDDEFCSYCFGPNWRERCEGTLKWSYGLVSAKKDMVDRPAHYTRYGIETIDALRGTMSPEEFNGFLKGNAFKYLTRAGAKDSLEQDLHKVCWYVMFLYLQNGGSVESLGKTYEYMAERFAP